MNPYTADPSRIPESDRYADIPLYGRYHPQPNDFRVDPRHVNSISPESLQYWATVLDLCAESNMIYPADDGRDVFAVGSVIVKSSHRHKDAKIDYTYADANEVQAIAIAKSVLKGVKVPEVYFAGQINGRAVLVQERLAGVCLEVAKPYLSEQQKKWFKLQAREILGQLHAVKPPNNRQARDYIVPDPDIQTNGRLNPEEAHILFSANCNGDMSFMHNDFTPSNCIVNNDKIVGLIDWEMAGYHGWKTAAEIHRKLRCPLREHYVNANVTEEQFQDMMWWNDIYEIEIDGV